MTAPSNGIPRRRRATTGPRPVPNFSPAPPPARWEVIRTHHDTGRVQLHDYDLPEDKARLMVMLLNDPSGITLAASGKLESGWVYDLRAAGGRG